MVLAFLKCLMICDCERFFVFFSLLTAMHAFLFASLHRIGERKERGALHAAVLVV